MTEEVPDGWALAGLVCTHPGASVVRSNRATGRVDIFLARGDTVTCTYTNTPRPTAGVLLLRKISEGGVGTFPFEIRSGAGELVRTREITTRRPSVARAARPMVLAPGTYRVSERPSPLWRLDGIVCNGRVTSGLVTVSRARGAVCTFTNERRRLAALAVREVTQGGTGTAGFTITELPRTRRVQELHRYFKEATTTEEDVAVRATGDRTVGIPFATYAISQALVRTDQPGTWSLVSVECDGRPVPFAQGRALVRLTQDDPRARCTFTNRLTPEDVTPTPSPEPETPPVVPGSVVPDLEVTKEAETTAGRVGDVVGYDLTARNDGEVTVPDAALFDAPGQGGQIVSATSDRGTCDVRNAGVACRLGSMAPGATATVQVEMRLTAPGPVRNLAALGSASTEPQLRDNLAVAAVRARGGPVACPASERPRAHAAC